MCQKLSILVFSFPPHKGNVGTAAYLDVFGSIFAVMTEMKAKGYNVEMPKGHGTYERVLHDTEVTIAPRGLNVRGPP
jgi:magnesium chelatase subunit H